MAQRRDRLGRFAGKGGGGGKAKAKAKPAKAKSFSKAERLRMTDARFGSRGSKADRMMDTF